jgi:hypothetical protein
MPARLRASVITAPWPLVRTSTAWVDHGRPGPWRSRTSRVMARASAASSAWATTVGMGPSGRWATRRLVSRTAAAVARICGVER